MSYQLLDQLTGPLNSVKPKQPWFARTVKYGINADVRISRDDSVESSHLRKGALFTNVLSPFGRLRSMQETDKYISDGINKMFIDDYGFISGEAVMNGLKNSLIYRQDVARMFADQVCSTQTENVVAVLVNMLRWYVLKSVKKDDYKVSPDDLFYDDGHVAVSYKDHLQTEFSADTEPEFLCDVSVQRFTESSMITNSVFFPNLKGFSIRQFQILVKYISTINNDYPVRLGFPSEKLVKTIYVPDTFPRVSTDIDPEETPEELLATMLKFIFCNRVESQFDLAYQLVAMTMFSPLPRSVEANAWVSPVGEFVLPKTGTIRGFMTEFVSGVPFCARPEALKTIINFQRNENRLYVHAIAATEALYSGLFELMVGNDAFRLDRLGSIGIDSAVKATPIRMFMEAAAFRFGREFTSAWSTPAGPDLFGDLMAIEVNQRNIVGTAHGDLTGYEYKDRSDLGSNRVSIIAAAARPALFPVLSMGVNDDRYYMNKLSYSAKMKLREQRGMLTATKASVANKMMNILRIGGYNAEVYDAMIGRKYRNWAANSNGQVMPIFDPADDDGAYLLPMSSIQKRAKSWLDLSNIEHELNLSVDITIRSYSCLINGTFVDRYNAQYEPVTTYPKTLNAETMTELVVRTGAQNDKYNYKSFLLTAAGAEELPTTVSLPSPATQALPPIRDQDVMDGQDLPDEDQQVVPMDV